MVSMMDGTHRQYLVIERVRACFNKVTQGICAARAGALFAFSFDSLSLSSLSIN